MSSGTMSSTSSRASSVSVWSNKKEKSHDTHKIDGQDEPGEQGDEEDVAPLLEHIGVRSERAALTSSVRLFEREERQAFVRLTHSGAWSCGADDAGATATRFRASNGGTFTVCVCQRWFLKTREREEEEAHQ